MGSRVLLFDENEQTRLLYAQLLKQVQCWCALASNWSQARAQAAERCIDLAIIEPVVDGVCHLEELKEFRTDYPEMALLIVTRIDHLVIANAALDIGVYGYMIKPVKPIELLINASNVLRRRSHVIEYESHCENLQELVSEKIATLEAAVRMITKAPGRPS